MLNSGAKIMRLTRTVTSILFIIALAGIISPHCEEFTNALNHVQVYVHDTRGSPVLDLTKGEISLIIDGIHREVLSFEGPYSRQPDLRSSRMNRKLFFVFDLVFSNYEYLQAAAEVASDFVDRYALPMDEISVSTFVGQKKLVTQEFKTHDKARIIAFFDAISHESINNGTTQEARLRKSAQSNYIVDDRSVTMVSYEPFMAVAARNFFWAISMFEQSIFDIPGEKCLILFAGGPSHEVLKMLGKAGNRQYLDYYGLGKQLQASQISTYIYFTGPSEDNPSGITKNMGLRGLADAARGRFFVSIVDRMNYAEELDSLTGSYYVLGYRDLRGRERDDHTVRVTVARPACAVRTYDATGFYKPFYKYTDLQKQVHLLNVALSEQPPSHTRRFLMSAFARDSFTPGNLGFLAGLNLMQIREVSGNKAEVIFLVFNEADDIIDSRRSIVDFSSLQGEHAYLYGLLSVPPGRYRSRIVVRNLFTGQAAVAAATVTMTTHRSDELIIYAPQMFVKEQGSSYQRIGLLKRTEPPAGTRDLLREMLVDPDQFKPVFDRFYSSGTAIWASVRCITSTGSNGKVDLSAFLIDRNDGREIPISIEIISYISKGNKQDFFIELQIPRLEPETYLFIMEASEPRKEGHVCINTTIVIDKE